MKIGIVSNPLDAREWREFEAEDPREFLMGHFAQWPASARIYDLAGFGDWRRAAAIVERSVLSRRDVTPRDEAGIERLGRAEGPLLVVVAPADPVTALIAVVGVAIALAATFLFMPRPNLDASRQQSPNNELSRRSNRPRPNGRIADIFGTVEATPDLLAEPYAVFDQNREIEVAYMIIGRGSYSISRVRDGDTALASIAGSSAAIYGPGNNPTTGAPPDIQIGDPIAEPLRTVRRLNEVNGQALKPTNLNAIQGEDDIRFVYPDSIEAIGDIDFTEYFEDGDALTILQADISGDAGTTTINASVRFTSAGEIEFQSIDPSGTFGPGDVLTVANAGFAGPNDTAGTLYVDLSGTYEIDSVDSTSITLVDPAAVNGYWDQLVDYPPDRTEYLFADLSIPTATAGLNLNGNYVASSVAASVITLNTPALVNGAWNNLDDLDGDASPYVSPHISKSSESWIGPFIADLDEGEQIIVNVVGLNGLYTLSEKKGKQVALEIGFELEVTPIDANDAAIGPPELFPESILGSKTERSTVGQTLVASPSFIGRASVRLRRTTASPAEDKFSAIVDEIKWKDCYAIAPVPLIDFGDVTTVMTRTVGTAGALSLKERRLNMRVTRKLRERIEGAVFGDLVATDDIADIIAAMCLDPFIGRRSAAEVDFDSIYDTIDAVEDYFGTPLARRFGYTFDDLDMSFEETVQIVAQTAFCQAYRQGRVIRLVFERATEDSALILNARNIMPGTPRRLVRFGVLDDHDGITLDYTDSDDGARLTLSVPPERVPTSARQLDQPGVRSYQLAYWHTWRAWNRAQFQNVTVELEATQEAALLVPKDRVLIADLGRPNIIQGEAVELTGLVLEISDAAELDPGLEWTIFLQHIDGTVEPLGVISTPELDIPVGRENEAAYFVTLSAEPRMALSLAVENFARATYMIVPDDDGQTRAFLIGEREPQSAFTESVKAINYSFLYYQHDELVLWVPLFGLSILDWGPDRHSLAPAGLALVADGERGKNVAEGSGPGTLLDITGLAAPSSYSKIAWLLDPSAGNLLGNANEAFRIVAGEVEVAHGASSIGFEIPDADWHHWAATYDANADLAALYLDGQLVAEGELDARSAATLDAADDLAGRFDDLRLYKRALTAREVRDIYLSSKNPDPAALTLEGGGFLTTEDGQSIILE